MILGTTCGTKWYALADHKHNAANSLTRADDDVRLARRIQRDVQQRGRSVLYTDHLCTHTYITHSDDDVRLARRIQRDVQERGRDVAGVIAQYTKVSCGECRWSNCSVNSWYVYCLPVTVVLRTRLLCI